MQVFEVKFPVGFLILYDVFGKKFMRDAILRNNDFAIITIKNDSIEVECKNKRKINKLVYGNRKYDYSRMSDSLCPKNRLGQYRCDNNHQQ